MSHNLLEERLTGRMIVLHKGRILLMERWFEGNHYFSVPGGGVESGETPNQAAIRELQEEMGVEAEIVRQVYRVAIGKHVHHIFLGKYISGEPQLQPGSPEAGEPAALNRFLPRWVPVEEVAALPFVYWQPLKPHLVHDLRAGFAEGVKVISQKYMPKL